MLPTVGQHEDGVHEELPRMRAWSWHRQPKMCCPVTNSNHVMRPTGVIEVCPCDEAVVGTSSTKVACCGVVRKTCDPRALPGHSSQLACYKHAVPNPYLIGAPDRLLQYGEAVRVVSTSRRDSCVVAVVAKPRISPPA